ncbi:MAG: dTDP-4-dehydrorhamnose reductase [Elusimicrobiales bacterium]
MKYLITGSNGQLAFEFLNRIKKGDVYGFDVDKLDISDEKSLKECIDWLKPDIIINCAAYNNVDKAESDLETAYKVNAYALRNMALFSHKYKTKIVHFSTDYVFPGKDDFIPYREEDTPAPLNKYGMSKFEGEKLLYSNYENFLIFRVSWLYGRGKQNFIYKLNEWSNKFSEIKVSVDEVSVPTFTGFVADISIKSIDSDLKGLFHLVPKGFVSRYDWSKKVFNIAGKKVKIIRAKQSDFNLPAKRPFFSAMSSQKISVFFGINFESWDYYLERYLKEGEKL